MNAVEFNLRATLPPLSVCPDHCRTRQHAVHPRRFVGGNLGVDCRWHRGVGYRGDDDES